MVPEKAPRVALASVIDFQGVAGLIDDVLGMLPERLHTLLGILSSSSERLEAQVVLDIVVRCRDPLAPLGTQCRHALKAAADLDAILNQATGKAVDDVCPPGHANAILNLCDAALRQPSPHTANRRKRIRVIRPAVKVAAVAEMNYRQDDIQRIKDMQDATIPDLWYELERYVASARSRRFGPRPRKDGSTAKVSIHSKGPLPARGPLGVSE